MIIFHHPAQAKVNRIKWIQTDTYKITLYVIPTYMNRNDSLCKKKVTPIPFYEVAAIHSKEFHFYR